MNLSSTTLVYSEQRYLQITNWFPLCHDGKLLIKQMSCSECYRFLLNYFVLKSSLSADEKEFSSRKTLWKPIREGFKVEKKVLKIQHQGLDS